MSEPTPMVRQYQEAKSKLAPGTLLLFRLGDFFELFDDDAREASNILGLTLTARNGRPMAGMPAHALDNYLRKLLKAGRKVAVCDQLEEAQAGKLVKRALTRIYTPGTILSEAHLAPGTNQYILSVDKVRGMYVASWLELSTGEWKVAALAQRSDFLTFLVLLQPTELVVRETDLEPGLKEYLIEQLPALSVSELPASFFQPSSAYRALCEALGVGGLKAFGLDETHPALGVAAALLHYTQTALCAQPQNLKSIAVFDFEDKLLIDPATTRQLEIFRGLNNERSGSLIEAMDTTVTSSGARLLERLLLCPSRDIAQLQQRYTTVGVLASDMLKLGDLRIELKSLRDLERILTRLQNRLRSPRELGAVRDTLAALPVIKTLLASYPAPAIAWIADGVGLHEDIQALLSAALADELPLDLGEGGYIRAGYDPALDHLKSLSSGHKVWVAQLEAQEQERTGIKSLKVKYNQNFGYFIEVTKANLDKVPADYIRRSTTVGGERFVTPMLQERQKEILSAESNAIRQEMEIFERLVGAVVAQAEALRRTAAALAWADVMACFAYNARTWGYVQPAIDNTTQLHIVAGRHPVVEQALAKRGALEEKFVPNDTALSADAEQILIITGPNMAGKSTYIRQTALIVIMAQVGSWVPATHAHIGLCDRLFSRIGSADALSRGESTFMVEMTETAYILRHATQHSLVILDEIGRGTSTYDGLSIAWACVEYLHSQPQSGPRTLFATHYHELTRLERALPRVRNYTVAVKEWGSKIIFVRQVVRGTADRSYGIHVAELAGMPPAVIQRATKLLESLEAQAKAPKQKTGESKDEGQLSLFS